MEFIDLREQQKLIKTKLSQRIDSIMRRGQYIMGPEISELEKKLSKFVGIDYCSLVASGTDALLLALMALGIKKGDEVITPTYSWISSASTIALLGATPIFVDIDKRTFNIDPKQIKKNINKKTKAIIAVSLFGQCAEIKEINKIASKYKLPVIEDAAQSFGATHHGNKSCSMTTVACTSFFPSKPLGCYGDGGACFTNNALLADKINQLRVHGQKGRNNFVTIGHNSRMDTIQAGILIEKFNLFRNEIKLRQKVANLYSNKLSNISDNIITPHIEEYNKSVFAQYTVLVKNRNSLLKLFAKAKIPVVCYYTTPFHKLEIFNKKFSSLKVSEDITTQVLSLPMSPYLTEREVNKVVDIFKEIVDGR